jgi:hypothetical protein
MFVLRSKLILFVAALSTVIHGIAASQPVADMPKLKAGDAWEFRQSTTPGDKVTQLTRKIAEIGPGDRVQMLLEDGTLQQYDLALNFVPQGKSEYVRILARYPLKVGDQWSYTRKFDNPLIEEKGNAKVVAYESVTVPAGTFDCFRVDVEASFSDKLYQQRNSWSRWYCPAVKWTAKERHETYIFRPGAGGATTTVDMVELVKFTPGE